MILDKLLDLVLSKTADTILEKNPSESVFDIELNKRQYKIEKVVINAGYDIYEYEKYEILHKSRPLLMCESHNEVRAMSWDERRYSATVEQGDAILNEANLIRVSLGEKVGIDNKTMTISYSYNDMGFTITDGTEKIYDMFMEVMGLFHSYPKEKDNECQISKSEQDLIAKLKEDQRRIFDIKKKHGKEYETLSTNNQLTRNNRWMKNVHLSINDVVELCELINNIGIHFYKAFTNAFEDNLQIECSYEKYHRSLEDYRKSAFSCYEYADKDYISTIVLKDNSIHIHIKIFYGPNYTYIGDTVVHKVEITIFYGSSFIHTSVDVKFDEVVKHINKYFIDKKCCP